MKVTIVINGENDAFFNVNETDNIEEYIDVLENAARVARAYLRNGAPCGVKLLDSNGNTCGSVKFEG